MKCCPCLRPYEGLLDKFCGWCECAVNCVTRAVDLATSPWIYVSADPLPGVVHRDGLAYALGWRAPFFIFAIPTLVLVVFALRLKEPVRGVQERLAVGAAYEDGDLVCCLEDGRRLHPKTFSYYFGRHVRRLGRGRRPRRGPPRSS